MCIAIYKPANYKIPYKELLRSYNRNSDGCGFSYLNNNHLKTLKFFSFDEFYNQYKLVEDKKMVLHFRARTAGSRGIENVQPFVINNNKHIACHNGTVCGLTGYQASDSNILAHNYLDGWLKEYPFYSKIFKRRILNKVGEDEKNKLILMSNKGEVLIINEQFGVWKNGVWYSNGDYRLIPWIDKRNFRRYKGKLRRFLHKLIDKI